MSPPPDGSAPDGGCGRTARRLRPPGLPFVECSPGISSQLTNGPHLPGDPLWRVVSTHPQIYRRERPERREKRTGSGSVGPAACCCCCCCCLAERKPSVAPRDARPILRAPVHVHGLMAGRRGLAVPYRLEEKRRVPDKCVLSWASHPPCSLLRLPVTCHALGPSNGYAKYREILGGKTSCVWLCLAPN